MIEVAKSVITRDKKVLLIKRSLESKFFPDMWDFPGGKREKEELAEEAVVRETEEETSLKIVVDKLIAEYNYTEQEHNIHFSIFSVKRFDEEVKLSKDHVDFAWVEEKDLEGYNLAPVVRLHYRL